MKTLLATLATTLLLFAPALAAEPTPQPEPAETPASWTDIALQVVREQAMVQLRDKLGLSESQQAQMEPILRDTFHKLRDLKEQPGALESKQGNLATILLGTYDKMQPLLTEEQRGKLHDLWAKLQLRIGQALGM